MMCRDLLRGSCNSFAMYMHLVIVFVAAFVQEQGSRLAGPEMQLNACRYARKESVTSSSLEL
jgi:hypothetical protein